MKLILKQSVPNLGDVGEVVNVKPGFGRNYLIPQGFAYIASAKNLARIEAEQARAAEEARRDFLEARRRASQLEGFSLSFQENAGEDGQLFGQFLLPISQIGSIRVRSTSLSTKGPFSSTTSLRLSERF